MLPTIDHERSSPSNHALAPTFDLADDLIDRGPFFGS
jgi:hypothetical protein